MRLIHRDAEFFIEDTEGNDFIEIVSSGSNPSFAFTQEISPCQLVVDAEEGIRVKWSGAAYQNDGPEYAVGVRFDAKGEHVVFETDATYGGLLSNVESVTIGTRTLTNPKVIDIVKEMCTLCAAIPSSENESQASNKNKVAKKRKGNINPPATKKSNAKILETSQSAVQKDDYETIVMEFQRTHHVVLDKTLASVRLEFLRHDHTIRPLNQAHVLALLNIMNQGKFNTNDCCFIVTQIPNSPEYRVIDGNHRFAAMQEFNKTARQATRISTIRCAVYSDLSFDGILHVTASPIGGPLQLPLSIFRKADVARKWMKNRSLRVPATRPLFRRFMKCVKNALGNTYPNVVCQLRAVSDEDWNTLTRLYDDRDNNPLDWPELNAAFWAKFCQAYQNNPAEALSVMRGGPRLPNMRSPPPFVTAVVIAELGAVEPQLLKLISARLPHSYKSNEEAIADLTLDSGMSSDTFHKILKRVSFFKGTVSNWDDYKERIYRQLKKNGKNTDFDNFLLRFIEINAVGAHLTNATFIWTVNPTSNILQRLATVVNSAVIVIHITVPLHKAPTIDQRSASATISLLNDTVSVIPDNATDIPITTTSIYIFHPCAVGPNSVQKLVSIAREADSFLGSVMSVGMIPQLYKLDKENTEAVFMQISPSDATTLLKNNPFLEVSMCYNPELKKVVDNYYKSAKGSRTEESASESEEDE